MDGASPHVLIVDNSRVDCLVASRILQSCDIRVTVVEGPKQALKFLDGEHDVNLILTDCCMADMTDCDLLMAVKESPKLKHIPVVIACSDNIPERINKCLDGGAKHFILKPVKVGDVPRILSYI
ncbi:two-component response regulator ORR12-like [Phragmites australis]|uniref:two-component response regulator ORR12-like n=1 Tax=Phragmites australis TaxID=29695 RepID=UPI002D7723D8|nr:two-component response regulator ORR12-like [Phragmites australis]